jgi:SAM-dependent methyltransferase
VAKARYDGLADEYDAFVDRGSSYFVTAGEALRRLLGEGRGRCLDVGCGGGHFLTAPLELGWTVVGIDVSDDRLRIARARHPDVELTRADATALPFEDESFAAAFSTFTHTDLDDFAGAVTEVRRVFRPGGRFVYIGNHPLLRRPDAGARGLRRTEAAPGYRHAGRWEVASALGTTPGGWRQRLGSFVHLPLADFLSSFSGFTIDVVEEIDDGFEYPKTIALALVKP